MKSVSDGLDSISVLQSLVSPAARLTVVLLLLSLPLISATTVPLQATTTLESVVLAKLRLTSAPPTTLAAPQLPVPDHFWDAYRQVEAGMLDEDSIRLFYPQELLDLNSGLLLSYNLSIAVQEAQKEKVIGAHLKLRVRGRGPIRVYRVEDTSRLKVERLLDSLDDAREEERVIDMDVTEGVPYSNQQHTVRLLVVFPADCELADSPTDSLASPSQSRASSASMVVSYAEREQGEAIVEESEHPKRRKRFTDEAQRRKERKERRRKNRKHRKGGEKGICHRKSMHINFEALEWGWILAPMGYEAYQCSGSCPFPFPAQANATNHAIIQGLLHNYNEEIPEPCCVPTQLEPLSILFRDFNGQIMIKNYPDMIVAACGCR